MKIIERENSIASQTMLENNENHDFCSLKLVFKDLNVKIGSQKILHGISGMVVSGQIMAVMGSSGSGKTTLLNTIAGRIPLGSGWIGINGQTMTKEMRKKICYVLQQDIFMPNLTLRETLHFAAMIQLPEYMPKKEKLERIEQVTDALDLHKCLDTVIAQGLSGGEKKRANIACELISESNFIMIDEPTSGLDSNLATTLMIQLKQYAENSNKLVITTIHQPSSQIYYLFNTLLLLANGQVAYFGETKKMMDFFSCIGLHCESHYNPADFALDQVKADAVTVQRIISEAEKQRLSSNWPFEVQAMNNTVSFCSLEMDYLLTKDVKQEKWPTTFRTQFFLLAWRNYKQSKSHIISKFEIFKTIFISIILGLMWFQLDITEDKIRDRKGLLFFQTIYWTFVPMFEALLSFPQEKSVLLKDRAAGCYRLSAYYLAKMISEIPLTIILPIFSFTTVYWMAGLNGLSAYFESLFILLLYIMFAEGLGYVFGAIFLNVQWAITVSTTAVLSVMLFGGYYMEQLPSWLAWAHYLSFVVYMYEALQILEFSNYHIKCLNYTNTLFEPCQNPGIIEVPAETVLQEAGITLPLYVDIIIILVLILITRTMGYIILRMLHKPHYQK